MSLLAGAAEFLLEHGVKRLVPAQTSVFSIAKLDLRFDPAYAQNLLDKLGIYYDRSYLDELTQAVAGSGKWSSRELFKLMGFEAYTDIDFNASEECSITHDLNNPLPASLGHRFDFVLEHGTLEHIFDVKTAFEGIARSVRVGGMVCHMTPLNFINHGFYNFSLNVFHDFYSANGFGEFEFYLLRYSENYLDDQSVTVVSVPYISNWLYIDPSVLDDGRSQLCLGFLAKKLQWMGDVRVPIQGIFDPSRHLPWKPQRMLLEKSPDGSLKVTFNPVS